MLKGYVVNFSGYIRKYFRHRNGKIINQAKTVTSNGQFK